MLDLVGLCLGVCALGVAAGYVLGYWRGWFVYRRALSDHDAAIQRIYAPERDENARLRSEITGLGARLEEMDRENRRLEHDLEDYVHEITGLHHALDAQAEADLMADRESQEEEAAKYATAPRKTQRKKRTSE